VDGLGSEKVIFHDLVFWILGSCLLDDQAEVLEDEASPLELRVRFHDFLGHLADAAADIDHCNSVLVAQGRVGPKQRAWYWAGCQKTSPFHGRVEPCKADGVVAQVGEEVCASGVVREGVVWLVWVLVVKAGEIRGELSYAAPAAIEPGGEIRNGGDLVQVVCAGFQWIHLRMLIQICRSWHGERSRERRVSVLVLPNLRDDVKASQDTHHPNCKFRSLGEAKDDFFN
jgi:hypothetical protein